MSLPIKSVISGAGSSRLVQGTPPPAAHPQGVGTELATQRYSGLVGQIQLKIHGLALGLTLGLGTMFLGQQGCVAAGQ